MSAIVGICKVNGVDEMCYAETERLLNQLVDHRSIVVKPLTENISMKLGQREVKLLVIPGGDSKMTAYALKKDGLNTNEIDRYLRDSGNLWGICAGLFCTGSNFLSHRKDAKDEYGPTHITFQEGCGEDRFLKLHQLQVYGPLFAPAYKIDATSPPASQYYNTHEYKALQTQWTDAAPDSLRGKRFYSFHSWGPGVLEESISPDHTVLMRLPQVQQTVQRIYRNKFAPIGQQDVVLGTAHIKNLAAVIHYRHDRYNWYNHDGNVVLQGVHFEIDDAAVGRMKEECKNLQLRTMLQGVQEQLASSKKDNLIAARHILRELNVPVLPESAIDC